MKKTLIALITLCLPSFLIAHTWTDQKGRELKASVYALGSDSITLRKLGGEKISVPIEKLSKEDQVLIALMDKYKAYAVRVKAEVFQSTSEGALCKLSVIEKEKRNVSVPSHYSKLNRKQHYETQTRTVEVEKVLHELAFVSELTTVSDGEVIDLVLWEYGTYRYTTLMNSMKTVPLYTQFPLIFIQPPSESENFGE